MNSRKKASTIRYDPTLQAYVQQVTLIEFDGLCSRCSSINFEAINAINIDGFIDGLGRLKAQEVFWPRSTLDRPFPSFYNDRDSLAWTTVPVFELGSILLCDPSCRLCRFLEAVSRSVQYYQSVPNWYLGITTIKKKRIFLVGTSATWHQDAVERGDLAMSLPKTHGGYNDDHHALKSEYHIQYDILHSEIIACQNEDIEFAYENAKYSDHIVNSQLWLIDCHELRVISAPANTKYIALSYVWGDKPRSTEPMLAPDSTIIRERLCQTVKDAMAAAIKFGVKYLWVDRYCIDQVNLDIKARQLEEMHQIFRQAWVTIVALGSDDEAGLPGVTSARERLAVSLPDCEITHIGPDLVACHKLSKWSLRAWTYQECCLSPRLLSFASNQVLLTCQHGSLLESDPKPYHGIHNDMRTPKMHFEELEVPVNKAKLLESQYGIVLDFQDALKNYCARALTQELDSLIALQGYLTYLNIPFYKGIPMFPVNRQEPEKVNATEQRAEQLIGACVGLSWFERPKRLEPEPPLQKPEVNPDRTTNQTICTTFPSWSWTSCRPGNKGFTCRNLAYDQINPSNIITTATDIRVKGRGQAADSDHNGLLSWTDTSTQLSNNLHLQTRLVPFTIPAQNVDTSLLEFQNSYLGGFTEPSNFTDVEISWPVFTHAVDLGLESATVTFHPDRRAHCACHGDLDVSPDPRGMTGDVNGVAALLFVEKEVLVEQYAAAHWLALRYDDVTRAWRRVGVLRVDFGAGRDGAIARRAEGEGEGDAGKVLLPVWDALAEAVRKDMSCEGSVDWVVIR